MIVALVLIAVAAIMCAVAWLLAAIFSRMPLERRPRSWFTALFWSCAAGSMILGVTGAQIAWHLR